MVKQIYVVKMDGNEVPYDEDKLRCSMERAGAEKSVIDNVLVKVKKFIYDGIPTKKLFRFVFSELRKEKGIAGIKYNLKQAIIEMNIQGAGFTYEKFMARILEKQGYKTKLNQIARGKFIPHEIDVVAEKGKETLMIEAKHHSKPWLGTDIKVALYVYARFLDVQKQFTKPMLVTNTKFSDQVLAYSKGVGIRLMGWNYPSGDSLIENIEKSKTYPITLLPLKKPEIEKYLKNQILTLDDLLKEKNLDSETRNKIKIILENKV